MRSLCSASTCWKSKCRLTKWSPILSFAVPTKSSKISWLLVPANLCGFCSTSYDSNGYSVLVQWSHYCGIPDSHKLGCWTTEWTILNWGEESLNGSYATISLNGNPNRSSICNLCSKDCSTENGLGSSQSEC